MFSFSDLHSVIQRNLNKIPSDIDLVVGIPRSGLVPASHIAALLNTPLQTLTEVLHQVDPGQDYTLRDVPRVGIPRHVLLVDDTSNTGMRIREAERIIKRRWRGTKLTTVAMCSASNSDYQPDLYFESSRTPRLFAWNMFNHDNTMDIAVDLDGVVCLDPTPAENDDGRRYRSFVKKAPLKAVPVKPVKAVITGRLERYRQDTRRWLRRKNIPFHSLLMNDAPSARYRREQRFEINGVEVDQISEFKSRMIREVKPILFVESNLQQAIHIHNLTGVNTYAFDHDRYFGSVNFEFNSMDEESIHLG